MSNLDMIAKGTPGFVGADLENLVNEAAILAARRNKKSIGMSEFEEAVERVIAGPERKSRLITDAEKRIIAYHEAGHAVVMQAIPECDPVHKVTIISRGMTGGYTCSARRRPHDPRTARNSWPTWRAAGRPRRGGNRLQRHHHRGAPATWNGPPRLARNMVTRWGMSDKLGPMVYGQKEELVFLGREISEQRDYSDQVAQEIDEEVRKLVNDAYEGARPVPKYREIWTGSPPG